MRDTKAPPLIASFLEHKGGPICGRGAVVSKAQKVQAVLSAHARGEMRKVRCEICYSSLLTYQSGAKAGDIAEEHWTFNGTLICAKCEELIKKRLIEGAFQLCDVPTRKLVFGLTH